MALIERAGGKGVHRSWKKEKDNVRRAWHLPKTARVCNALRAIDMRLAVSLIK